MSEHYMRWHFRRPTNKQYGTADISFVLYLSVAKNSMKKVRFRSCPRDSAFCILSFISLAEMWQGTKVISSQSYRIIYYLNSKPLFRIILFFNHSFPPRQQFNLLFWWISNSLLVKIYKMYLLHLMSIISTNKHLLRTAEEFQR